MRFRRPSAASIIAVAALFVALGGTAVASHFLITNTSQIKPSVLRQLRGAQARAATVFTGAHAVLTRVRQGGSFVSPTEPAERAIPLAGSLWTQHLKELDEIVGGEVTLVAPSAPECEVIEHVNGSMFSTLYLDGHEIPGASLVPTPRAGLGSQSAQVHLTTAPEGAGSSTWLFEPAAEVGHTLTIRAWDNCRKGGGHFAVSAVSLDVLGFH
jgi:hypothetical protein